MIQNKINYQKGDSGIHKVETRVARGAEQQIKAAIWNTKITFLMKKIYHDSDILGPSIQYPMSK